MIQLPFEVVKRIEREAVKHTNSYLEEPDWEKFPGSYSDMSYIAGATREAERAYKLVDVLHELIDLMEATRSGEYKPDSFTCQPARKALAEYLNANEEM